MNAPSTGKPKLLGEKLVKGTTQDTAFARQLDTMHGHTVTMQDQNGQPVAVYVDTKTGTLRFRKGEKWEPLKLT